MLRRFAAGRNHVLPLNTCLEPSCSTYRSYATTSGSIVKEAFDAPLTPYKSNTGRTGTGRFRYDALQRPKDFLTLSRKTTARAQAIVSRLLAYTPCPSTSCQESKERDLLVQVKQIDRLSDLLCSVIDLAEVVRNLDPDPQWIEYADKAYSELCLLMNQLNTHVELYQALKRVHDPVAASPSPKLFAALSVSSQFLADFEKSGIHLPKKERDKFVSLSDDILSLGRAFTAPTSESTGSTESASDQVFITLANLERWNPAFVRSIVDNEYDRSTWDKSGVYISASSQEGQAIRRDHPSSSIREQFYRAAYPSADNERLEALEQLLTKRAELARLVGKDSWAHVTLSDKMAKSPENVMSFLTSLSERNKPLASRDVSSLADFKSLFERDQTSPQNLEAWDRDFYMVKSMQANNVPSPSSIAPYFSVGSCIAGLSALFSRIYGIRFEVEECQPGEIWLPDQVRKISVYDESEGKIGEIYCDLFVREGKPQGAAHFTVRCSRRLDDDTAEHDLQFMQGSSRAGLELPVTSKPVEYRGRKGKYQLPIVVLTCDFEAPTNNSPGLLTRQEAETLFHEMGHAMHSMIGRTDYHNVAGTRCATDFVELPSVLMEHFMSAPSVLDLFARHWKTGERIPQSRLDASELSVKRFAGLENSSQICMAILDQEYHSPGVLQAASAVGIQDTWKTSSWSTNMWEETQARYGVIPPARGTAWQANFSHLFGYGATYYSYLFDRAIASRVYAKIFAADPLSREAGEKYKNEVLKHGGGKDPWTCVGSLLQDEALLSGDQRAMDAVGSWNINE